MQANLGPSFAQRTPSMATKGGATTSETKKKQKNKKKKPTMRINILDEG
jgi:hypothetical protein